MNYTQCRVLHVLPSLDQRYGGPLRQVLDLSARTLGLGLDSYVLGFGPLRIGDNPLPDERIYSLPPAFPKSYCFSRALEPWLRQHLRRFHGVVIHGAWLYPGWCVARACRAASVPYACLPQGMLEPWAVHGQGRLKAAKKLVYWYWRERRICKGARCIFFSTNMEAELAKTLFHFSCPLEVLIPFGIEREVHSVPAPMRSEIVQPPERKVVLFLSRVHPKKNVHFLLRAWAAACVPPPWFLVIAGPGEEAYLGSLRRLASQLGISAQVAFLGMVTGQDKAYLFQRASWFVLPSQQENFGVAVLEAVAHQCPVAISDRVYLAESFRPGSEVLPLRLESWVEFFRERMMDSQWRDQVMLQDREHLLETFSIDRVAANWAATLRRYFLPSS